MSGTYHALWSMYGIIIQFANTQAVVPIDLLEAAQNYATFIVNAALVPIMLSMFVLFSAILLGKSNYPRWMALFSPFLAFAVGPPILTPIAADLAPPYGAFITGAFFNSVMLVFFFVFSFMQVNVPH